MELTEVEKKAVDRKNQIRMAEKHFDEIDQDGNGWIDMEELKDYAEKNTDLFSADPVRREKLIKFYFSNYDANGDGVIQKSEWLEAHEAIFDAKEKLKEKTEKLDKSESDRRKETYKRDASDVKGALLALLFATFLSAVGAIGTGADLI